MSVMETNFSSDSTEAREASTNIVDNLLSETIDQVDMETYYSTNDLEFFEKVLETKPAFSPGSEVSRPVLCMFPMLSITLGRQ